MAFKSGRNVPLLISLTTKGQSFDWPFFYFFIPNRHDISDNRPLFKI